MKANSLAPTYQQAALTILVMTINAVMVDDPNADSVSMDHEFSLPKVPATQKSPRHDA